MRSIGLYFDSKHFPQNGIVWPNLDDRERAFCHAALLTQVVEAIDLPLR